MDDAQGRLFDIKKFATHDGDGIRTTLFLKGCPLRCVWCQNPEGLSPEGRLLYLENRCIHCGVCRALTGEAGERDGAAWPCRAEPADWPALADACPTGALAMDSARYTVDGAMEAIRQDLPFYRYGGGITLSGGEPLMQPEFCRQVLLRCQEEGIHTAMETSLYAPEDVLESVLPLLNLVFADVKLLDEKQHREHTGVSNGPILKNLARLLRSPARDRVVVRTPLIPGRTATEENVAAIAAHLAKLYPDVRYELLNYNPLAMAKYPLTGLRYCFETNPPRYSGAEMDRFRAVAKAAGIKRLVTE